MWLQVGGPGEEPETAAPPAEPDMPVTEAAAAPDSPAKPAVEVAPVPAMTPPAEAILPSSPPAAVRLTMPSPQSPAAAAPSAPTGGAPVCDWHVSDTTLRSAEMHGTAWDTLELMCCNVLTCEIVSHPGSGAPTLQDQLRAKLLANRGLSPVPEPIKPSEGSGDDDRKREAEVVEQPVAKRARTTSESNTAAQSQAESFLASLEESSAAAATLAEDADVDVEAYVEEQGDEEQQEEEYEGEYEEEGEGDGDGEAEVEAEDHSGEGEDAEQSALEQQQDEAAQDAEDMMEDDAEAAPVDGQHADADMKVHEEELADAEEADAQEPEQADRPEVQEEAALPEAAEAEAIEEEAIEEKKQGQHKDADGNNEAEQPVLEEGAPDEDKGDEKNIDMAGRNEEQEPSRGATKPFKAAAEGQAGPSDGTATRPSRKREKAPIEWKAQASAAKAGPAAPSLSPAAVPYIPKPGRGATSGRAFPPGRGGPGRLPHVATPGPLAGRGLQSLSGNLQQRGGRARGHARGSRGRRQPGAPEGQPPAEGQQ